MATGYSITRDQAETFIREGGSVLHNGSLYTTIESLPPPEEFTAGDPEAQAAAAEDLRRQVETLSARLAALEPAPDPPEGDGGKGGKKSEGG
jgi:hypothetical protein